LFKGVKVKKLIHSKSFLVTLLKEVIFAYFVKKINFGYFAKKSQFRLLCIQVHV